MDAETLPGDRPFRFQSLSSETKLTLLLVAVSFFISGVPRVYTQTAAHTLFLQEYGPNAMPYAYLAEALCVPFAGWLFLLAEQRLSLRNLLVGTLAVDMLVQIGFRVAIWLHAPNAAAGTIVWFEIEFVLSSLCLWGLANSMMTLRQGKRLFGFISAGEPVAVIICGATTPLLLDWLQPADLFLFSALGAGVGIVLILWITASFNPPDGDESESESADGGSATAAPPWWKNRYILILIAVVVISQLCYFFVDNTFYMVASARYPTEGDLAKFLGVYSAVMGSISLICSVVLAAPLVRRFGIRGALLTLPILLSAGTLAVIFAGRFGGGPQILFWLIVSNKVIDQAFRYTIDKTNSITLYQPLRASQRVQVQAALESMIEPLSGGIAGLALYVLLHWFGFTAFGVTHVIAVMAISWAALVLVQHRGYLGALRKALARGHLIGINLDLNNEETLTALKQSLASNFPGKVIYGLKLLEDAGWQPVEADTQRLLVHPAREVRLNVAKRIEQGRLPLSPDGIGKSIAAEKDGEVRGALIEALSAADLPNIVEIISPFFNDSTPEARLGAYVGLLRHGGIGGEQAVNKRLLAAEKDVNPQSRRFVALVVGRIASPHFFRPLETLLADPDHTVRSAALQAAGNVKAPELWPGIFANLAVPSIQHRAIAAAASVGEPILEMALVLFRRADASYASRRAIIIVAGRIGSAAATEWLLGIIEHPDRRLKVQALNALWLCGHKADPAHRPMLRRALLAEAQEATQLLAAWKTLKPMNDGVRALRSALEADVQDIIYNLFCLLALLLKGLDIREARIQYTKGGPVRRAYVIEMLDNALDNELKPALLPLIEAESTEERALGATAAAAEESSEIVRKLVGEQEERLREWTKACALYALAGEKVSVEELRPAIHAEENSVRETAEWLLAGVPKFGKERNMLIVEKVLILRGVSIFAEVSEHYLNHLAASAQEVTLPAGKFLFEQGDLGTSFYVIVQGKLRVHVGENTIAELGDYQVVGEMAALDPEPRSASVSAIEETLLLRITSDDLDLLISDNVDVARGIIQVLCQRLRGRAATPSGLVK